MALNFREVSVVALSGLVGVFGIFIFALLCITLVTSLRNLTEVIVKCVWFFGELIVSLVSAFASGLTITLSIVMAACIAAFTLPPSAIEARVIVAVVVASSAIAASALCLITVTEVSVDVEIAVSVISAVSLSVGCAAAWSVGVMSLIERETKHVGIKMTSILDAVQHNNHRFLKVILKLRAGIKQRDLDLALIHAVKAGFEECAEILLRNSACPNAHDSHDNTALSLAVESGFCDIAKILIDNGASVNLASGNNGIPLHQASKWGYEDCVDLLIARGSHLDIQDGHWRTPLVMAAGCAHGANSIMRTLIRAGCDVTIKGLGCKTALHFAALRDLDLGDLLDAGAEADASDSDGNTPLHMAANEGSCDVVKCLLDCKANANFQNKMIITPLHCASKRGHVDIINQLISRGACLSSADCFGRLPIWYAAKCGHFEAVWIYIKQNVPLSLMTQQMNPILPALENDYPKIVKILLLAGCERKPVSNWLLQEESWDSSIHMKECRDWFLMFLSNPPSLQQLCRLSIRGHYGEHLMVLVSSVTLPKVLLRYLMMEDFYNFVLTNDISVLEELKLCVGSQRGFS